MLWIAFASIGGAITALTIIVFGQQSNQEKYFWLLMASLLVASIAIIPWRAIFTGIGWQAARPVAAGPGIMARFLPWLGNGLRNLFSLIGRVLWTVATLVWDKLSRLCSWTVAQAEAHPAMTVSLVLLVIGLFFVWFAFPQKELVFSFVLMSIILIHAAVAAFLYAVGQLNSVLRFFRRNKLFLWLYTGFWLIVLTGIWLASKAYPWYGAEFWAMLAFVLCGARIIYGGVTRHEWTFMGVLLLLFSGYFLVREGKVELDAFTAAAFSAVMYSSLFIAITYAVYKGVNRFLPTK